MENGKTFHTIFNLVEEQFFSFQSHQTDTSESLSQNLSNLVTFQMMLKAEEKICFYLFFFALTHSL